MGTGRCALYPGVTAGAIVAVVVLAFAAVGGLAWQRRNGRLKQARQRVLTGADLGHPLGTRATLLQFSSSFCAPCRATRQLLADVAAGTEGVAHVELDVTDRLDLARLLDIRRTPTVLVLGPQGQVAVRASGVPRRADVMAAVTQAGAEPRASFESDRGRGLA